MLVFAIIMTMILCLPLGFTLGFRAGDKRAFKREVESHVRAIDGHAHIWKTVSANKKNEHPNYRPIDTRGRIQRAVEGPMTNPKTDVLKTCFCGKTEVETLPGHWTLEELTTV